MDGTRRQGEGPGEGVRLIAKYRSRWSNKRHLVPQNGKRENMITNKRVSVTKLKAAHVRNSFQVLPEDFVELHLRRTRSKPHAKVLGPRPNEVDGNANCPKKPSDLVVCEPSQKNNLRLLDVEGKAG